MKKTFLLLFTFILLGCASQEMIRVRQMKIQNVDFSDLQDGEYKGSFSYSGFEYIVKTTIENHTIINIEMLHNRESKHAKQAEGVLTEIIERQTPGVDAISGATTTSKAIMKAVENSLLQN
jgi:uncharacterized protein with FMN-binding domain